MTTHPMPSGEPDEELFTIAEVARILRVPVAICGTGATSAPANPTSFKIGRDVRYLRREVTRWFHEQASSTGAALDPDDRAGPSP